MPFGTPAKPVQSLWETVHLTVFWLKQEVYSWLASEMHLGPSPFWLITIDVLQLVQHFTLIRCPVLQELFWYQNFILAKNALRAFWL